MPASTVPSDLVTLAIGGTVYGGWTDIEITTSIDAVASSFSLSLTERWPGQPQRQMPRAGDQAVVAIGGVPVITGYVDSFSPSLSADGHTISAQGRSLAGDLVDCSAVVSPGSWSNRSLEAIAAEIAAPLGVTIIADSSTAPVFARFALQPGESCWAAIERMLHQRGLLGISLPDGSVHLVSPAPGPATVSIAEGRDFIQMSAKHDMADRFASYIALGQSAGSDQVNGAAAAGPRGQATDDAVKRARTLVVIAEDQATPASLAKRAQWEASVRIAKAQTLNVTIAGWRQPGGALWQMMQLVDVSAPSAWIADTLMVVSVHFTANERGKAVQLGLGRPEAYGQMPVASDADASSITKAGHRRKSARFT